MIATPVIDPVEFQLRCWPRVRLYDKQREIVYSVLENEQTYVPAGNKLGKDFIAGFIAVWAFMAHRVARVITTSVKDDHLRVLWGEIGRFIQTSEWPLDAERGGPLVVNHHDVHKVIGGKKDEISYLRGMVSQRGEGLSGHHAPYTLLIIDEASGVDDLVYKAGEGWAKRWLIIGNPNPCTNFFVRGVKAGDKQSTTNRHLFRRVIRLRAEDSPNVRLGLKQKAIGRVPTDEVIVPDLLTYSEYLERRANWDPVRQCIGLDGEFYEGAENLLFPPEWLNAAEARAANLAGSKRTAKAMGIDSGEGVARTVWAVCDEQGLIRVVSKFTPDTAMIPNETLVLMQQYGIEAKNVLFDAGGGGKQHADLMRSRGYKVQTVAFGESATPQLHLGTSLLGQRIEAREVRYIYRNRRAEMYGMLREKLDPSLNPGGVFAIPAEYAELRRQLSLFPLRYDAEGRMVLPPKNKRTKNSTEETLVDIIGHSPDEADALVLAVYRLFRRQTKTYAGSLLGKGRKQNG